MAAPDDTQTAAPPDYPSPQDIQAALAARGLTAAAAAPPPSAAPAAAADPAQDYIRQQLALLQAPLPSVHPDTTPAQGGIVGLLGRIGMALAGGSVTDTLSPAQRERAGIRALGDFGTSLMAGSGYYPGKPMFGGLAQGFEGATRSEAGSEQQVASYLGAQQNWQLEQQKLQMERLKEALPLLRMEAGSNIPNALLSANTPAVPGTAGGAGKPVGGGGPLTAYGKGGPAGNVPVPPEYMPLFEAASKRTGVPVDLLIAQARQESGFNPGATGGAGEVGIMQIHPKTAVDPGFGLTGVSNGDVLRDPARNINFGADYLAARAKSAGADLSTPEGQAKALQAYNGGGDPNYVANVTRYMPPVAPYNVATTGAVPGPPSGSTTAPAAPGQTPPPASTAPAAPPTFADFQAQNPIQITPAEQATMDSLEQAKKQAATELQRAPQTGVDRVKALEAYTTAANNVTTAQRQIQKDHTDQQAKLFTESNSLQQQAKLKADELAQAAKLKADELAQTAGENERNRQATERLENIKAGNTYHQELDKQSAQYAQENTIKPMAAQATKAHQMNLGLSQLLPVLQDLPKGGGALGAVLDAHPDLAPLFNTAGILTDRSADAVRLVNGLVSNISTEMKPTGLGALREYEWDAFKAQLPNLISTRAGQQKAVAMLMNMNDRIAQEHSWMNNYFNRKIPDDMSAKPGAMRSAHNLDTDGAESAQQRMDKELGPIIPSFTGQLSGANQAQWEQSLPPGKPYYKVWAVPDPKNPGQPRRDANGNVMTTKTLEVRPWQ